MASAETVIITKGHRYHHMNRGWHHDRGYGHKTVVIKERRRTY